MPRSQIHSIIACPILRHHRPVESYESRCIGKISEQRGEVAVSHKNLGMRLDLLQIQLFEKIVRAVSATRANDRAYLVSRKHFFQFAGPALHRSRKVKILLKNGIEIKRPVAR